jgi:rubrerythrin
VEASFESSSPEKHAAEIHKGLARRRVKGMEYFGVDLPTTLTVVQQVVQSGRVQGARGPVLSQAELVEPPPAPMWRWVCGLCKHEWTVATTPDRCPLCQSASIIRLSAAAQAAGAGSDCLLNSRRAHTI